METDIAFSGVKRRSFTTYWDLIFHVKLLLHNIFLDELVLNNNDVVMQEMETWRSGMHWVNLALI